MYIKIPQSEAAAFKRTISKYEAIEPVELSNGDFILPVDVLDRLQELSERGDYIGIKATYVLTIKSYLDEYELMNIEQIKPLLKVETLI